MATNLPPVPHSIPMLDTNGKLNQRWSAWFKQLFVRAGGASALSNEELYTITAERLDDESVTSAKIASSVAGSGLTGGAGSPLAVGVDGATIEISSDALRVKDSGITTAKVNDGAVSFIKMLATDWTSSLVNSGYQKLPSGLYIQWGVTGSLASASSNTISFPTAFPTACRQVIAGVRDNSAVATTTTGQWGTGGYTASNFALYNRTSVALTFNWMAIGH